MCFRCIVCWWIGLIRIKFCRVGGMVGLFIFGGILGEYLLLRLCCGYFDLLRRRYCYFFGCYCWLFFWNLGD